MSGGHYNYLYSTIEMMYKNELEDKQLNELLVDFCNILHDLEWYKSGDTDEEDYENSVKSFKEKWLK